MPGNAARKKLTPPKLAAEYGIDPDKVLAWIRAGELRATNVATKLGGRPRYIIDVADIAAFEERRSAVPRPATPRRRRPQGEVIQQFF